MSTVKKAKSAVTVQQVASYLAAHPDFFQDEDELLLQMRIMHKRGSAISLVERQMQVLRERNVDMHKRLNELMDVARDNDRLFDKVRRLILEMLEAQTVDELVGIVDDSLRHSFQVPFASLTLFHDKPISIGRSTTLKAAQQHIGGLLVSHKAFCGVLRAKELVFLFGQEQAEHIQSAAVATLEHNGIQGVLAVGSDDQQHYNSSMDTLFLTYLADVLARVLPSMLASLRAVK